MIFDWLIVYRIKLKLKKIKIHKLDSIVLFKNMKSLSLQTWKVNLISSP